MEGRCILLAQTVGVETTVRHIGRWQQLDDGATMQTYSGEAFLLVNVLTVPARKSAAKKTKPADTEHAFHHVTASL
eukprot:1730075-Amphidinium_carterae.1